MVVAGRVALGLLAVGALLCQLVLPTEAAATGRMYPEVEHLVLPYTVAAIVAIGCIEVSIVITWRLLSTAAAGAVFQTRTIRWVGQVRAAMLAFVVIVVLVASHLLFVANLGGPGILFILVSSVAAGLGLDVFLRVVQELLRAAISNQRELSEVI